VQTSLDLRFFERNFNADMLKDVYQISFCGDDGDPIYGRDFLEIVKYLKSHKPNISLRIVTNGSHKKEWWWQDLAKALNQYDEIHFSIDGWDQASNEQYRVNSDWASTMTAVKTLRDNSTVIMTWAAIAFRFNQTELGRMGSMAAELGFDRYQVTKSTKFGSVYRHYSNDGDDIFEPTEPSLVAKGGRFERMVTDISKRTQLNNGKTFINDVLWENIDKTGDLIPMCHIGNKGL
jgi:MoaA/NifB/PqqE/SkfB family radical SAM enzyme